MNSITANITDGYLNDDDPIYIDGISLFEHIRQMCSRSDNDIIKHMAEYVHQLVCTYMHGVFIDGWCGVFMSELIGAFEDMTIPILICPDDTDFTCTTVTADMRFADGSVYWDRIGLVDNSGLDLFGRSYGIIHGLTAEDIYSEKFRNKYGASLTEAVLDTDSPEYYELAGRYRYMNELMILRNHYCPYINDPKNIITIGEPHWRFTPQDYFNMTDSLQTTALGKGR